MRMGAVEIRKRYASVDDLATAATRIDGAPAAGVPRLIGLLQSE